VKSGSEPTNHDYIKGEKRRHRLTVPPYDDWQAR
jgi:hypothetical protein